MWRNQKAGPLITTEEELEEAAAAEQISMDATAAAVLSGLDAVGALLEDQRVALEAFLCGNGGFYFIPHWLYQTTHYFISRRGALTHLQCHPTHQEVA